jgi:integrase
MAVGEATAVLAEAALLPHGSRYVAALLQGIRQAEALGLTWESIDFERGLMTIDWQLQALPYRVKRDKTSGFRIPDGYECRQLAGAVHLVRPKSKAGWRVIPMVPWMRTALLTWREIAPESAHGLVWPNPDGSPRYYKHDDAEWYDLQKAAGVTHPTRRTKTDEPAPYTIHETRHTTATLLLEAGVDPAIIVQIIGHSSIITTRSYQHVRTGPALHALDMVAERLQLVAPD